MNALAGKVAIVTGASRGIGAGIAKEFAAQGARVVVNYLAGQAGAGAVIEHITPGGGTAIAVQADVSDKDDVKRLFATAIAEYGTLDVLVNNAAVYVFEPIEQVDQAGFLRCHEAGALTSRARWNPAVSASGGGVRAASRWLVRLVAIPLNTARPGADPSWKEVVIRAAANPA